MNARLSLFAFACSLAITTLVASPALATFTYTTDPFAGTNYTFDDVQETTSATDPGDPEPLFGNDSTNVPSASGDTLSFSPLAAFSSSSTDGVGTLGVQDPTASTLQLEIVANAIGTPIDTVTFTEFGEWSIDGTSGATGIFASIGGTLTVTEQNGVAIPAQIIGITVAQLFLTAPGSNGTDMPWQLVSVVDVGAVVPGATRLTVSLNNTLNALSEGVGYSASIDKQGLSISLPEPTTVSMLILGLIGAALSGRRSRM